MPTQPVGRSGAGDDGGAEPGGDGGGVVGRVVVDDDELVARPQLGDERGEEVGEGGGLVAGRDDDGDRRRAARRSPAGSGRVDHSSSQPMAHPAMYRPHDTPAVSLALAGPARPSRVSQRRAGLDTGERLVGTVAG